MKKIRLIFASTKDSDMHYALMSPVTSSIFYIEINGKKYALLSEVDFGIIPKSAKIKSLKLGPLLEEAKKFKFAASDRNKLAFAVFEKFKLIGRKIEVPIHFPLDMAEFLRARGAKLVPVYPFFPERAVKSKEEVGYVKECIAHTKSAMRLIENILRRSKIRKNRIYYRNKILTSEFLKQVAEYALIEKGMFDFLGMIVSTGAQTAIPHHTGAGPIRPHQPIVCDIFPRHRQSGYFADMTRTYVKGKPSPEIQKMYNAVVKAQAAAIKKIHAGAGAKEIYDAAAEVIYNSGYDIGEYPVEDGPRLKVPQFIHGLGHGVGLDIHEKPSLKAHSEDILEAGNVITVEPGLYCRGLGGVRIEDMILVTKTGCRNLTNYPRKLIIP